MQWTRQRRIGVGALAIVGVLLLAGAGWYLFAPKPTEMRQEAALQGTTLASGTFRDGDALHHVSGSVRLLDVDGRSILRFEGYDATSGPDVYFYLTPRADAMDTAEVEGEGLRVLTSTMLGQATLRGDFHVELPEGMDVRMYGGLAVWCERYNVLFGSAELMPTPA